LLKPSRYASGKNALMNPEFTEKILPHLREQKLMSDYYKRLKKQKELDALLIGMTMQAESIARKKKAAAKKREWIQPRYDELRKKYVKHQAAQADALINMTIQAENARNLDTHIAQNWDNIMASAIKRKNDNERLASKYQRSNEYNPLNQQVTPIDYRPFEVIDVPELV
jgi:uncharacterized protein involved in exopolysaccharide biosynthesis